MSKYQLVSSCCSAGLKTEYGGEGTNFYYCGKCKKACDATELIGSKHYNVTKMQHHNVDIIMQKDDLRTKILTILKPHFYGKLDIELNNCADKVEELIKATKD